MSIENGQGAAARPHTLQCDGRKKLSLTGVKEVVSANDTQVLADTNAGMLEITGADIKIQKYNSDEGALAVTGEFSCLKYDSERAKGFFKRLFK